MKPSIFFILFLFVIFSSAQAQKVHFGVSNDSRTAELHSTDPLNGKRHYLGVPMTMPKGAAAIFFMQSSIFSPSILLFSPGNGKNFGKPWLKKENNVQTVRVSFTAPSDTTFYLILTSANENETGAFTYGYFLLDSSQMNFNYDYSPCERLIYLFNHWQVDWELIPGHKDTYIDDYDDMLVYEYWSVSHSFDKHGNARVIDDNYEEVIYSKRELSTFTLLDKDTVTGKTVYEKTCADIKACLDMNAWKIETETSDVGSGVVSNI